MSNRTTLILVAAAFVIGGGVGSCSNMEHDSGSASDSPPASPAPAKTKTVTKYKDRSALPPSCRSVLNGLSDIKPSENNLMDVFVRGSDVMNDGHEALTSKDGSALNEAREKLYKLDTESNKSAQRLSLQLWPDLERDLKTCKSTDAYKEGK